MDENTGRTGRPRKAGLDQAILAAALDLARRHGFEDVTTAMIAAAAGTSKQALYRRWPSKAELFFAALLDYARTRVDTRPRAPRERRLEEFLRRSFRALRPVAPALRGLMAWAQSDADLRERFVQGFIEPRRARLREILGHGADVETAVRIVFGYLWYALLLDEEPGDRQAEELARFVRAGLAAPGRRRAAGAGPPRK